MPAKKVNFIPKGYHAVTPYLAVEGASEAIVFYKKVFGAKEVMRMPGPNGTIGHAEIAIGDSRIMLADEFPEINFQKSARVRWESGGRQFVRQEHRCGGEKGGGRGRKTAPICGGPILR